jgi:hypothetical protein
MLIDLGINPTFEPPPPNNNHVVVQQNGTAKREPTPLERHLEEGFGEEFEFMDGGGDMTLTRNVLPPEEKKSCTKTDSGFADEIFSELSRSGTFKRGQQQQQTQQQQTTQQPTLFYGTQIRYQRPLSSQKPQPWKRRDSLSHLPTTDIIGDDDDDNGKLPSQIEMSSRRHRRLSTSSYSGPGVNLSYESLVMQSAYEGGDKITAAVVDQNGGRSTIESDHRLEEEERKERQ